jgi:hypothetical protein
VKKPKHTIVPNGSLDLNLETEDRHTRQVSQFVKGERLKTKKCPRTFTEFLRVNASEAIRELFEPFTWLKSLLVQLISRS